jgi:mRNA interferase RelE/StbE
MFEVYFSNEARKQYRTLEPSFKERVNRIVKILSLEPFPRREFDLVKLHGVDDCYRIRIGNYRLIYNVNTAAREINILKIKQRESAY